MPRLSSRYCGMVWYFANSARHWSSEVGGSTPVIGFHSTIDRPDSVKRVAPPTIKVRKIIAAAMSSHSRTGRSWISDAFTGPCIVGADQHQRVRGNALLYCGWPRLGSAGDALDQLDGASGQPQNLGRVDAPEPVREGGPCPRHQDLQVTLLLEFAAPRNSR